MDDRQLIEDLLSALEYHTEQTRPIEFSKVAIQAAREYLQKPTQQEPVAWEQFYPDIGKPQIAFNAEVIGYVAPQRTWVGLTDDETETLIHRFDGDPHTLLDEVNARLKEKNNV